MRYATIALLFWTLTATASQQDTSDCNLERLLRQQDDVLVSADFNNALFEEGISHCSQEELGILIKGLIVHDNLYLSKYNNLAKNFNTLLRLSRNLLSSTETLIKESEKLHKENRALQIGQKLLLRMQELRSTIPASAPTRRELTCKTTTIGMFKTTKCIEE